MAASRAVLCGLVRDAAADLPRVAPQLERIGAAFGDHRILLYENDSADGTVAWLDAWAGRDPRVGFVSERLGRPRHPPVRDTDRMVDLADYRSRLQAAVLDRFGGFDHVVVVDTDLLGYDADGVAHGFGQDGWDALAAKGVSWLAGDDFVCPDAFAFRFPGQPDFDRPERALDFVPPRGAPLVPVLSAFGGMALYPTPVFAAGRYGSEDCEHAVFHASLRAAGHGRIFLDPSLLTLYPDYARLYPRAALRAVERRKAARARGSSG
jgi:hypothetical protein